MAILKGVAIGAGYFSNFHYDAWQRMDGVEIAAICDLDRDKGSQMQQKYSIGRVYTDYLQMLEKEKPDFVDIITPPETHYEIVQTIADQGIPMICQKALAPTFSEASTLVNYVNGKEVRFMVHDNFRFQPWHRELRKLLDGETIGDQLFNITCRMRMGDGWGPRAYLDRQPYFQKMEKLLIYETGIHFIDTYRYLFGDIESVYARLKKLNPVIAGEDCGVVLFGFQNGADGLLDGNRFNEPNYPNPRYTFGEFLAEGNRGSIRIYPHGKLTIQNLGGTEQEHPYNPSNVGFAGDCVYATQQHFIENLKNEKPFETSGTNYLHSLAVQDAVYQSAEENTPVFVNYGQ